MNKRFAPYFLFVLCSLGASTARADAPASASATPGMEVRDFSYAVDPCGENEKWNLTSVISEDHARRVRAFTDGSSTPIYAYGDGAFIEKTGLSPESKLLGQYLNARGLFASSLFHPAREGFEQIASQPPTKAALGIQLAALACLNRISRKFPSIPLSAGVIANIRQFQTLSRTVFWEGENQAILWDAAQFVARGLIGEDKPSAELDKVFSLLDGAGPYRQLPRGLWLAHKREFTAAIAELEAFVGLGEKKLPPSLVGHIDEAYLTLGRAYELSGDHEKGILYLRKVDKDSNYTVRALTELAWNHLMRDDYPNAIGVAVNLQKAGFSRTFSPESLIILAMAFNEICQYPSSFRSIRFFYRNYRDSHQWLTDWYARRIKKEPDHPELYALLSSYARSGKSPVPSQVITEWARSPVFVSHQDEMNLLLDEKAAFTKFKKRQYDEAKDIWKRANSISKELRERIAKAKGKKLDDDEKKDIRAKLAEAKRLREYYQIFSRAVLRAREQEKRLIEMSTPRVRYLVENINRDLAARNVRMLNRIRELIENAYLVQVEIYNGASEDIVWRNAHPEYKGFLDKLKSESQSASQETSWNWGPVKEVSDGTGEVWEDELDSLRATLQDNCSNRDKYVALTLREAQRKQAEEEKARRKAAEQQLADEIKERSKGTNPDEAQPQNMQ